MELFANPAALERYLTEHSEEEDQVLKELARHTYLKEVHPRMLSGHILGNFLSLFSRLISPLRILEIGTYTGYSAICLARGLKPGGMLTTIEINDELRNTALKYFRKAKLEDRIRLINGDALKLLPNIKDSFDLIFLDANKDDYPAYYKLVFDKIRPGGYLLADNALWGGKVLDKNHADQTTRNIDYFNKLIQADRRVFNTLLPIRDGLMLVQKT
jgi:predicted O-methyltransferase YrrM